MTYQIIYIDETGNIEKVTNAEGQLITAHKDTPDLNKLSIVALFDRARRCTYGGNGNCYCTGLEEQQQGAR